MRKPVLWFSNQVRHIPVCTATDNSQMLEILDLGRRGFVLSTGMRGKQMRSLICVFIFSHMRKTGFLVRLLKE